MTPSRFRSPPPHRTAHWPAASQTEGLEPTGPTLVARHCVRSAADDDQRSLHAASYERVVASSPHPPNFRMATGQTGRPILRSEICQFFEMSHQRPLLTWPFRIRRIAMIVFQFLVVAATPHSSSI